jgi:DNA modification methylase
MNLRNTTHKGDSLQILFAIPADSVDSIVTDPPYELGFMGKAWDKTGIAYNVELWKQCLRVLKPGGHMLCFGGTRTYHRMACAIEDAGFEIRDCIQWIYGSGFPKSKLHLKPANEPICVARKPGPINPLNIEELKGTLPDTQASRWPANVILDGCAEVLAGFPYTKSGGGIKAIAGRPKFDGKYSNGEVYANRRNGPITQASEGSAARFFYCAKPSPSERLKNNHPTVKPVRLIEHLVRLYCPLGGVCLDPFGGSFTTAVACINTGRDYICIEKEEEYFRIGEGRIAKTLQERAAQDQAKASQLFV